jgi:hypothetical protein
VREVLADPRLAPWATLLRPLRGLICLANFQLRTPAPNTQHLLSCSSLVTCHSSLLFWLLTSAFWIVTRHLSLVTALLAPAPSPQHLAPAFPPVARHLSLLSLPPPFAPARCTPHWECAARYPLIYSWGCGIDIRASDDLFRLLVTIASAAHAAGKEHP